MSVNFMPGPREHRLMVAAPEMYELLVERGTSGDADDEWANRRDALLARIDGEPDPGGDPMSADDKIDISGIDKAELLAALHNGTRAQGMGLLRVRGDMTAEDARPYLDAGDDGERQFPEFRRRQRLYFDYVCGRPIKCDISGDTLDPGLYDRDAGAGRAAEVVAKLRAKAVKP